MRGLRICKDLRQDYNRKISAGYTEQAAREALERPLAIVVIGGLVTSTLLTLVLLPSLFQQFGTTRKT